MTGSFLAEPTMSAQAQELYDEDLAGSGYVWNVSRLWAHQPDTMKQLFALMSQAFKRSGLSFRQRGILVVSAATAFGDSYCTLAWSGKLGKAEDNALVAAVLDGSGTGLTDQEKALAAWARKVARDPNATGATDVQALREAGFDDGQIFAVTAPGLEEVARREVAALPDARDVVALPGGVEWTGPPASPVRPRRTTSRRRLHCSSG
jgi:uncharacterized peroxidase-related enzyme